MCSISLANWGDGVQGEPSITSEVFQTLDWVSMPEERSFWRLLLVHNMLHRAISTRKTTKIPDKGCPISLENWGDGVQGEPSIASEVFQNLDWVSMPEGRSIWRHLLVHNVLHRAISTRKITKIPDLGCTLSLVIGVMGYKESHPLLLKCCKTLIGCLC